MNQQQAQAAVLLSVRPYTKDLTDGEWVTLNLWLLLKHTPPNRLVFYDKLKGLFDDDGSLPDLVENALKHCCHEYLSKEEKEKN